MFLRLHVRWPLHVSPDAIYRCLAAGEDLAVLTPGPVLQRSLDGDDFRLADDARQCRAIPARTDRDVAAAVDITVACSDRGAAILPRGLPAGTVEHLMCRAGSKPSPQAGSLQSHEVASQTTLRTCARESSARLRGGGATTCCERPAASERLCSETRIPPGADSRSDAVVRCAAECDRCLAPWEPRGARAWRPPAP